MSWLLPPGHRGDAGVRRPQVREAPRDRAGERDRPQGRVRVRRDIGGLRRSATRSRLHSSRQASTGDHRQLGALAGLIAASKLSGLDFFSAYPITPASSILEELARHKAFGVRTFQAEDEIAAARRSALRRRLRRLARRHHLGHPGIVLKQGDDSAWIMLQLPLLILDIQRAGPRPRCRRSRSRPTLMVLFKRNSESLVPVLAASTPSQCFHAAIEAARIALKYRTPVYLLSDAYLANGSEPADPAGRGAARHLDRVRDGERGEFQPYERNPRRSRGRGRSRARPGSSTGSAGSRRRT